MRWWGGNACRVLAAALLLGSAACGADDTGSDGGPLDDSFDDGSIEGRGGTGGSGGSGGAGGSGGTGGTGGIGGTGGTGGSGGTGGTGGTGGSGGSGGTGGSGGELPDEGKGSECDEGEGLLHLKKDFCAPVVSGIGIQWAGDEEERFRDCDEVQEDQRVRVVIQKVAPKRRDAFDVYISEEDEYRACVPVGTYVVEEKCDELPPGFTCLDPYPVELKVKEKKATKHTFINLVDAQPNVEQGLLEIEKDFCLAPQVDGIVPIDLCEAVKTDFRLLVEILQGTTVVTTTQVGEDQPALIYLDPGTYTVREVCPVPGVTAFECAPEQTVTIVANATERIRFENLVDLEPVAFQKEVRDCMVMTFDDEIAPPPFDCTLEAFEVKVKPVGATPLFRWFIEGKWRSNETELRISQAEGKVILLPPGLYEAKEKPADGFEALNPVIGFEVPEDTVMAPIVFRNKLDIAQCAAGLDGDGDGLSGCAEPVCLQQDYLGCSRDACYWSASLEFLRVCHVDDPVCANADVVLEITGKDTIFGPTPPFGGTFVLAGGAETLSIPAPCGTYGVRVVPPAGYEAFDVRFDFDVPGYPFPIRLFEQGGVPPPDPYDFF